MVFFPPAWVWATRHWESVQRAHYFSLLSPAFPFFPPLSHRYCVFLDGALSRSFNVTMRDWWGFSSSPRRRLACCLPDAAGFSGSAIFINSPRHTLRIGYQWWKSNDVATFFFLMMVKNFYILFKKSSPLMSMPSTSAISARLPLGLILSIAHTVLFWGYSVHRSLPPSSNDNSSIIQICLQRKSRGPCVYSLLLIYFSPCDIV